LGKVDCFDIDYYIDRISNANPTTSDQLQGSKNLEMFATKKLLAEIKPYDCGAIAEDGHLKAVIADSTSA